MFFTERHFLAISALASSSRKMLASFDNSAMAAGSSLPAWVGPRVWFQWVNGDGSHVWSVNVSTADFTKEVYLIQPNIPVVELSHFEIHYVVYPLEYSFIIHIRAHTGMIYRILDMALS